MSVQLLSSSGSSTEEPVPLARAEAVLCDMDGTLVDSSAVVESMWSSFARDYGMSERFDEIMAYSPGRTGLDTIRRFLPELTADEQDAIYKRFAREEIVRTAGRMAEIPGAAALVTTLIEVGVPLALVTSAPIELMRVRMEEACVPIPPAVVSAGDVERGKPDPAPTSRPPRSWGCRSPPAWCWRMPPRVTSPPGAPAHRSSSWARASPRPTRASPASRTSPGSPSPPTSAEPGILRAALQNFCWGTREMPSSRLGTERHDSGTRRFPQPSFDTASPQST